MKQKADFFIKRYQLPLLLLIISVYFWYIYFQSNLIYLVGLLINIAGLIIWWSAKITLGENWDAGYGQPKIKELVDRRIYSKICHPLYWGINLTLIGLVLIHRNIFLVVLSLIIVIYFFRRMQLEDKFLIKKLGEKYLDYKKKTWI